MASINDLQNDPKNARKRTDRSAKLIKQSLEQYGAARSIVIDENNRILAGNGTIAGAKAAGIRNLKIIEAEIIRDEYGLAMSSRNRLLSKSGINIARNIFQILKNTKEHFFQNQDIQQAEAFGKELFNENDIEYDYLNFVDPKYFETPDKNHEKLLLITAAYVEGIRLIDNMEVIQ